MKYYTRAGDAEREFRFERRGDALLAHCGERTFAIDVAAVGDGSAFSLLVDGQSLDVILERADGGMIVQCRGERIAVEVLDERERLSRAVASAHKGGPQPLRAAMPGVVVDVRVGEGDRVAGGQTVVVLEAMKMQNPLQADAAGVVKRVHVAKGQAVAAGALLVEIETE